MVRMTGEEFKTVDNCFKRTKSTKQGEMKKIGDFRALRLCDLTGEPSNSETKTITLVVIVLVYSAQLKSSKIKQKSKSNVKFNLDLCWCG